MFTQWIKPVSVRRSVDAGNILVTCTRNYFTGYANVGYGGIFIIFKSGFHGTYHPS